MTLRENAVEGFPDDTIASGPTVIGAESLATVADWFGLSPDDARRRFRANLTIEGGGAFWEDRYHATAVQADEHLHHCLVYIDLNMVRAGAVNHPSHWVQSGYREIQRPPKRYGIIDLRELTALCGFGELEDFQRAHAGWGQPARAYSLNAS